MSALEQYNSDAPRLRSKRRGVWVASSVLIALLSLSGGGCSMPRYAMSLDDALKQEGKRPRTRYGYRCTVGAHRGASERYPENTMAALKAAELDRKYAFIEFDVQYSKEGQVVVFHDRTLFRRFGSMKAVGDTTVSEMQEIAGGEIAVYGNVMGALTKRLNIEIKSQDDVHDDARLVDEIVADLRARKRDKDVLISSISSDVVAYVNRVYPEMPTGQIFWLTSSTYLHFDGLTQKLYDDIRETEADYLMLHVSNLRNIDDLLKLKPKGKTVVFWDFDDTMYLVHKDGSDRLWGDSGLRTFWKSARYRLSAPFQRSPSEE
ncbi:MAG: hypothetical protein HN341_13750 [Verrucomicrobia bacterium]|jgi:glycerophosphoryl diester phosphodiesterase|nr:hypothetical protein [Verrucomicrobiota bacterium]